MVYFLLVLGFIILLSGAEFMVRGAVGIAERLNISKAMVGMTIVALGTSSPEFVVSLNAALSNSSGLAIGNVIGSNIANIFLVIGFSGLVAPIIVKTNEYKKDGFILLVGTFLFVLLAFRKVYDITSGITLLVFFIGFLSYTYSKAKKTSVSATNPRSSRETTDGGDLDQNTAKLILFLLLGFGGLINGADLLVKSGIELARKFGIHESIIGLSVMAFGTSLPELAATAVAAFRKHSDIALGNIIGSNIFNIVGVMGIISIINPLDVPIRIIFFDMWVVLIATLLLMPFMLGNFDKINRYHSSILLIIYLIYIIAIYSGMDKLVFR